MFSSIINNNIRDIQRVQSFWVSLKAYYYIVKNYLIVKKDDYCLRKLF